MKTGATPPPSLQRRFLADASPSGSVNVPRDIAPPAWACSTHRPEQPKYSAPRCAVLVFCLLPRQAQSKARSGTKPACYGSMWNTSAARRGATYSGCACWVVL